jgi:hypothetical protein
VRSSLAVAPVQRFVMRRRECSADTLARGSISKRLCANRPCTKRLFVCLLDRLDPDDIAQFLAFVFAGDFPTAGSRYINTY